MEKLKRLLKSRLILGLLVVTIFAIFRIVSYYNIFLVRDVYLQGDDAIYAMLSQRFLEGDFLHAFHPYWNSGFPIFTIPFYLITHSWEKAQILLSMTASVALIFVMYFTLGRTSLVLGIIAAYVVAFSTSLEDLTLFVGLTEPLYILLLWLAIFFSWKIVQTNQLKYYAFAGGFFGLAYLIRTDAAYTILAVFLSILLALILGSKFHSLQDIKLNLLKILAFFLMFFLINIPYVAVISQNLSKPTISGKYGYLVAGHFFTPEKDRLTTFAHDIWSTDYPNYSSLFYDYEGVLKEYLRRRDTILEYFPKKFNELLSFYFNGNLFKQFEISLVLIGIIAGLVQRKFLKFTLFLLIIWFGTFLGVANFMDTAKRYLAFSYPFLFTAIALAVLSLSNLVGKIIEGQKQKKFGKLAGLIVILIFFTIYFSVYDSFNRDGGMRNSDQKEIGDWIKSQNIDVIMARTEGISFYSGAKLVYVPSAPPDVIVDFAKNWGVEYILSRPHESSWPYMKAMVDPNFKHKDLKLIHSFDDGTLVWKVSLTDEEKRYNYRTGKPIEVFCRSNEWSKTDDPNLPVCPDRTY